MVKEVRKRVNEPYTRPSKMSLDAFRVIAQQHQGVIKEKWRIVQKAYGPFLEEEDIWPDQCNYFIDTMYSMSESVREFYRLLTIGAILPISASSLRYPLIMALHRIDDLISNLTSHIVAFRDGCEASSRQRMVQKQEIQCKFEAIVQSSEDALHNVKVLLDQIRFQEKAV